MVFTFGPNLQLQKLIKFQAYILEKFYEMIKNSFELLLLLYIKKKKKKDGLYPHPAK